MQRVKYYEYGRYDKAGLGIVRNRTIPDVIMGSDGRPTEESLQKVLAAISKVSGHGTRIEGAYIQSDDFSKMNGYAQSRMADNSNSSRTPYSLYGNNCGTFMCDVAKQDEGVGQEFPWILDARPNSVISELRSTWQPVDYAPSPTPEPEPAPDPEPDPDRA